MNDRCRPLSQLIQLYIVAATDSDNGRLRPLSAAAEKCQEHYCAGTAKKTLARLSWISYLYDPRKHD